ncbi:MAG: hypothetical protein P4M13_11740 [Alphaproteobacteria bacterium]|nr:hypothetical protein [Alphaproteobacteria bacterium]
MKNRMLLILIAACMQFPSAAQAVCINSDGTSGRHPSVEKEYNDSDYVISGVVESQKVIPDPDDSTGYAGIEYKIRVVRTYKGTGENELKIYSENSSGRFPMNLRTTYLLFIEQHENKLGVDSCGNSGLETDKISVTKKLQELSSRKF